MKRTRYAYKDAMLDQLAAQADGIIRLRQPWWVRLRARLLAMWPA